MGTLERNVELHGPRAGAAVGGDARLRRRQKDGDPALEGQTGRSQTYEVHATRALGDLSSRTEDGWEVRGYFQIEHPQFALEKGPAWLRIDPATGVLSGTPEAAGPAEVAVTVTIDQSVRTLDESALKWGNEKVLGVERQRVGSHTQKFVVRIE